MLDFLHNNLPHRVFLSFGVVDIYWYGLLIAVAIFICLGLLLYLAKSKNLASEPIFNLAFYVIIFGFAGARVWHVIFYNLDYFLNNPLAIFKVWQGGLAITGGLVAGSLVIYFFNKRHKFNLLQLSDLFAVVLPLGQAIGRWGNYFNQELYGKSCNYSWCIPIDHLTNHFHPVFLYESLLTFILFLGLFVSYRFRKLKEGSLTFIYIITYALIRFSTEFLRTDIASHVYGLNWMQWLCLLVIVLSLVLLYKSQRKSKA